MREEKPKRSLGDKIILIIVLLVVCGLVRTTVHYIMDYFFKTDPPSQSQSQQIGPMQQYQIEQAEKEYAAQLEAQRQAEAERAEQKAAEGQ